MVNISSRNGIRIGTLCFIVLLILKLAGTVPIVSWSWLKVILLSVAAGLIPVVLTLIISVTGLVIMWVFSKIRSLISHK